MDYFTIFTQPMINRIQPNTRKVKEGFVGQKMIVLPPDVKQRVTRNELIKRFYLTAIGYYPHAVAHDRERKAGSGQYILLYCTEGSGTIEVGGKTIALAANAFYILPKNIAHHYYSSADDPWSIYWVHFTGEYADYLFKRYQGSNLQAIPFDEKRIDQFNTIFDMLESGFEERMLEISQVMLLEFISAVIYLNEVNPSLHNEDAVNNSIRFMRNNLDKRLTLEDLASQQRLSVTHYSRLFKSKTGSSPNDYFNRLKVQKSCQYLYFTDRNIKEICTELGFDDPYYFSRLFKKLMGISPAHYKGQHKRN